MNLYQSLAKVKKLSYDWSEKSDITDSVQTMAEQMTRLPSGDLLTGDYLIMTPDVDLVKKLYGNLKPENMNVGYVDPKMENATDDKTLKFYEVKYRTEKALEALPVLEHWKNPASGGKEVETEWQKRIDTDKTMKLPTEITNIPDSIDLQFAKAPLGEDTMGKIYGAPPVNKNEGTERVWYRQGSMSENPKVNIKFALRKAKSTEEIPALDKLLYSVYNSMLSLEMGPKTVDIRQTGISYSLSVG